MQVAFINLQGDVDMENSYRTAYPDFDGQLVYGRLAAEQKV